MSSYGLSFISDDDLFSHVKDTVEKYRFSIDLKQFNHNLVDPIKLTFDSKVYKKSLEETIESEIIRQMDKSNTNHIGYFHQNIFKYIEESWSVPKQGFDVVNEAQKIYVEMKNKHNTMNSSSSQKTYIKMQHKILRGADVRCMLVEVIAKKSQNIAWKIRIDGENYEHESIRRVSIDKFYEIVTGESNAFKELCRVLPTVIDDVVASLKEESIQNSVVEELHVISDNLLHSLYQLTFAKYEGFETI